MPAPSTPRFHPSVILHGGAGNIQRSTLPPPLYAKYHASLLSYLRSTTSLLKNGATAIDVAVHVVFLMEDDELFNCGRGSVFTSDGTIEMEASLMVSSVRGDLDDDDSDKEERAGSIKRGVGVMLVRNVRHPIQLAREALLRTGADDDGGNMHSQFSGPYAEACAHSWGLEFQPDSWFWTQKRWDEHMRGLKGEIEEVTMSQGTVGCVCLDQYGDLATATSTGGLTNKKPGRIGDTPTLGAGFWAENWVIGSVEDILDSGEGRGKYLYKMEGQTFYRHQRERLDVDALRSSQLPSSLYGNPAGSPWNIRDICRITKDNFLSNCLPHLMPSIEYRSIPSTSLHLPPEKAQPLRALTPPYTPTPGLNSNSRQSRRRAIAVSGTGNGDSFLRVAAARTAAAMVRFSSTPQALVSLSSAVTAIAGPGGELQRSAGRRWEKTGEGEGGIIGIEAELPLRATDDEDKSIRGTGELRQGRVVFDFNCGGMFRAWMEDDPDHPGKKRERVMVFREDYV